MENLIKVEIKLICYLSDDEDDRVDFNTDIELSEDNYHKLITVVKNTGIAYECLIVGSTRPFIIITDGFEEADKINNVIQDFLEKTQNCQERKKVMENKIIVPVYIYYGDDQFKYSQYLYNSFRARRSDCDRIYNSLVDGPYVCACRSSKDCYDDGMAFRLSCQNKDDALKIFSIIEGFNEEKVDDTLVNEEDSAPKNNSISSEIDYIAKNLDDSDLFLQLAEEAVELSQACLKYVRAYRGNNPTKDSADVYLKNILEELTDVRVSADALNIEEDIDTYINKIHRWADRIRKKNGGNTK